MTTTHPTQAATRSPDLVVGHVRVRHAGRALVDVTDVRLEPGRALTVVGESGSGKSLLAHAVVGTLAPELEAEGRMTLGDATYDLADRRSRRRLWGRQLALLPQEPALALDPTMRVRHQVAEGVPGFGRRTRRAALATAQQSLAGLGLGGVGAAYPHTLSGGMAQRVAYAAATIGGAPVLVVDEPSKGLDAAAVDRLAELLLAHLERGGLLLTITHDLRLARRLGGEVMVMRDAEVVERGPVGDVLDRPAHEYSRRLVAAEPARWRHPWLADTTAYAEGPELVAADGVTKRYGAQVVLHEVDLRIGAGERWSVSGPSGSGKSTLGNVLLGLTATDAGVVRRASEAGPGRCQKLYQDPALSFPPSVALGRCLHDVARRHRAADGRLAHLLGAVGLRPELLERRPGQVSGGELQRLAVVRAMLTRPALVLADEATSRLDLLTQERTTACLVEEVVEEGAALLWITHDADLAAAVAHRDLPLG